jgi:hypothetical protein
MSIIHAYSNTAGDFTGTITGFNSQGSTQTLAATNLVRPSDWNSGHNMAFTLTGNTNNASTVSGTNVVLSGGNNITLIGSGSVIGISAPNDNDITHDGYNPFDVGLESVAGAQGAGTLYFTPMQNAPHFKYDRAVMVIQNSNASNSSNSATLSMSIGVYTRNVSTLSLLQSASTSYAVTASGTVGSYSLWGGVRNVTVGMTTTLTDGDYWVGIWSRTTTGGGAGQTFNQMLASQPNSSYSGILGAGTNASDQIVLGQGRYSASFASAMPTAVGFSDLQGNSSILLRPPVFRFESGTV